MGPTLFMREEREAKEKVPGMSSLEISSNLNETNIIHISNFIVECFTGQSERNSYSGEGGGTEKRCEPFRSLEIAPFL